MGVKKNTLGLYGKFYAHFRRQSSYDLAEQCKQHSLQVN